MCLAQGELFAHIRALSMSTFQYIFSCLYCFIPLAAYLFFVKFIEVFLEFSGLELIFQNSFGNNPD